MITITWLNAAQKGAAMQGLADRVRTKHVTQWTTDVAEAGEQEVKNVIQAGGVHPTKKGGPRIKSGSMISAVAKQVDIFGDGSGNAISGWPHGGPAHTIWQEQGTLSRGAPKGIAPMLAIERAKIKMMNEAMDAGTRMLANIAGEWNGL